MASAPAHRLPLAPPRHGLGTRTATLVTVAGAVVTVAGAVVADIGTVLFTGAAGVLL